MPRTPLARAAIAAALLRLVSSAPLAAQGLPSRLSPTNPAPIVYCPPERLSAGPPAPQHVLNVFLPQGAAPAAGWPVVISTGYGGGNAVPPLAALTSTGGPAPLWKLVSAGIAVVHFGTPGLSAQRGLWYPPGHPSGRYESFLPAHDNPEKSAEWALQWIRVQTLYPFDLARIGFRGSSGGAVLAIRTAMGPERARTSGSAHVRASTRVAAVLAIQPPTSAWALEQGAELTIAFPKHLEQAARPFVPAPRLELVAPELQKDYSLMREAFTSPAARANNVQQPLCLVYGDPVLRVNGEVASFDLDASGFPVLYDKIKQPQQHDSWFGYVFWKRLVELSGESAAFHAAHSVFAMRDVNALAAPYAWHTRTYSGTVMAQNAAKIGHDWLVARLRGPQPLVSRESTAPGTGPAGGPSDDDLVPRGTGSAGSLVLGLKGPAGASAWITFSVGGAPGSAQGLRDEPGLDLGGARGLRLAPAADGYTELVLPLPELALGAGFELGAGLELRAQALVREPGGRLRLTNALVLGANPRGD